jgi:hypothetical protein
MKRDVLWRTTSEGRYNTSPFWSFLIGKRSEPQPQPQILQPWKQSFNNVNIYWISTAKVNSITVFETPASKCYSIHFADVYEQDSKFGRKWCTPSDSANLNVDFKYLYRFKNLTTLSRWLLSNVNTRPIQVLATGQERGINLWDFRDNRRLASLVIQPFHSTSKNRI